LDLEAALAVAEDRIANLTSDVADLTSKLQAQGRGAVETSFTRDLLRGLEFEEPLATRLGEIAANISLHQAVRVRCGCQAIATFYEAKIDRQRAKARGRAKKIRIEKAANAALQRSAKEAADSHKEKTDQLNFKINQLEESVADLRGTVKRLRAENRLLEDALAKERTGRTDSEEAFMNAKDIEISQLKSEHENIVKMLQHNLEVSQRQISGMEREYNVVEVQLGRFRALLRAQKQTGKRQEAQIAALRQEIAEREATAQAKHKAERTGLTDAYESTISILREQCESGAASLQELTVSLADRDAQLAKAKASALKLAKEKQRLDGEVRSLLEQTGHQKQLLETNARSHELDLDTKYRERIGELTSGFNNQKRHLQAIVADSFSGYFDLSGPIDDYSFRAGLDRTKREITRLTSLEEEIRQLLGAAEDQSTQDLVAQFVFARWA
jgi:hypothetical protein